MAKVDKALGHQGQEADQDLVAPLDDPARVHRSDDRRAQRQAARARLCHDQMVGHKLGEFAH
jgi:hypothetical protein